MNRRVIIRPNAEADVREAWAWYESQRTGLGDELLLEICSAIRRLEMDPERRPFYYRDFRRLLTRRFPYKFFIAWKATASSSFASCTRNGNIGDSFELNGVRVKAGVPPA